MIVCKIAGWVAISVINVKKIAFANTEHTTD